MNNAKHDQPTLSMNSPAAALPDLPWAMAICCILLLKRFNIFDKIKKVVSGKIIIWFTPSSQKVTAQGNKSSTQFFDFLIRYSSTSFLENSRLVIALETKVPAPKSIKSEKIGMRVTTTATFPNVEGPKSRAAGIMNDRVNKCVVILKIET